jgi:hypothetical protein
MKKKLFPVHQTYYKLSRRKKQFACSVSKGQNIEIQGRIVLMAWFNQQKHR